METLSPKKKDKSEVNYFLNFYQALKLIAEGKKVTKLEWENEKFYGVIDNEILKLHKDDDKLYNWILGAGDLGGEDYIEV